jgi:hypothetical protein
MPLELIAVIVGSIVVTAGLTAALYLGGREG